MQIKENPWTERQLKKLCLDALVLAAKTIKQTGSSGKTEIVTSDAVNTTTNADIAVSQALKNFFLQKGIPADLYSEELGVIHNSNAQYLIGWDDIDGTENWRRAEDSMPYATILFVYKGARPRFADALVGGMYEHTKGYTWIAIKDKGCYFSKNKRNFKRCCTSRQSKLSRKTGVRLDLYAMRDKGTVVDGLNDVAWLKDAGSSGFHLASVSNGMADAFVNSACKAHEFGAGYLMITEAGGFVSDWDGNSYTEQLFDFNAKYPIVCGATEELARKILRVISETKNSKYI